MPKSPETQQKRGDAYLFVAQHLAGPVAFPNIHRDDFCKELMDRIKHPNLINQGKTEFCGPAAVLHALAKDDPMAYATMALKLLETGKATVRGWTLDAGALKAQSVPKDMEIGCCDWVTMASIRTNVGFGQALTSVTTLASGTLPFEIAASFKNLGYKNILNETYSTVFWKADDKNLAMASGLWKKKYRVVLCVNDNLFNATDAISLKPNHFCTLKSEVEIGEKVKCRVWQWGLSKKEPTAAPNLLLDLKKDQFIKHYFGFVAAGDL